MYLPASKHLLIELLSPVAAGSACIVPLVLFASEFERGATWSGLNPGGGGPGFLLLLSCALISFLVRSSWVRSLPPMKATLQAAFAAALCGAVFIGLVRGVGAVPSDAAIPLASGVIGSFFVPRVVVAVLNDTWSRAEAAALERAGV